MNNSIHLYFQEVLDKKRRNLLPKLSFFTQKGFYLAGGTALALQYGHRESIDFDFFVSSDIDTVELFGEIIDFFSEYQVVKTHEEKNTLYIEIDGIKMSCMSYHHVLLSPLISSPYISLAADIDIACMKLWAIQNRATNKDYVDLYYIFQKYSLKEILELFYQKFGENIVSENYLRKSLVFFDDVNHEELKMHKDTSWEEVKQNLEKIVFKK